MRKVHRSKTDQSETNFFILRFFVILMKHRYRLSMTVNPNPRSISLADASLVGYRPIRNTLSYFKAFGRFDCSFLEVIYGQESECEGFCFNQLQLIRI